MNTNISPWLAAGMLVGPIVASAQTETLNYQGNPFTTSVLTVTSYPLPPGTPSPPPTIQQGAYNGDSVVGSITLNSPLGANVSNSAVAASGFFTVTDPTDAMGTDESLYVDSATFTTVHGIITGWNVSAVDSFEGPAGFAFSVSLSSTGDNFFVSTSPVLGGLGFDGQASNTTAGAWTVAPEIDPTLAATALTLLFGGVAVMRGRQVKLAPSV